jgi:hypothetical protein
MDEDPDRRARWSYLTDGLEADRKGRAPVGLDEIRRKMEVMFDNIIVEDASTSATHVFPHTTFAFPLIRRVFPRLIAQDIFSVQPMTQPTGKIFFFQTEYTGGVRRDLEANFDKAYATTAENPADVAELNFRIVDKTVTAESKKLKARWTVESEQDLAAYHGLSAGDELMAALSDELIREIDRTLLDAVVSCVPTGNAFTWSKTVPTAAPWNVLEPKAYYRTLFDKLVDANDAIFGVRYVNAQWIVAGLNATGFMEKTGEFRISGTADPANWQVVQGVHLFGVLANRWVVFKDPWLDADLILMGYKGPTFLHAGFVYAPYIPVYTTPPLTDPKTFATSRGMMSRFAKDCTIPEQFAKVSLTT